MKKKRLLLLAHNYFFHKDVDFLFKVKEEKGGKCWLLESLPPNGWNHIIF